MLKHPLDPDNKVSDKKYNEIVDRIQNDRYKSYIFWKIFSIFLTRLCIAFIIVAAIILFFCK